MFKKICLLGLLFSLVGCATNTKFTYPVNHESIEVVKNNKSMKKVAVIPFSDLRSNENKSRFLMYLIPILPYSKGVYDRPDSAKMFLSVGEFNMDSTEDLAKASAYSLNKSKLFKNSYFTFGGDKDSSDYILEGDIKTFKYDGTMYSYGLSLFAPYLWVLGLPMGSSKNIIDMEFRLLNSKTEEVVWSKSYQKEDKITQGLYYNSGKDVDNFAVMYQDIMNEVILDISQHMDIK